MQKYIANIIKFFIAGTLFVPLVLIPASFIFPFIVPKILLFRSLVLCMLAGYLILFFSYKDMYKPRFSFLGWTVFLFFISMSISTFFGVDWYRSFWDNHERMLGLFTLFHFVLYFFIASTVVKEWRDWQWLFRVFLFAGGIVMYIGVWQKFVNVDALLNRGGTRVSATLGNAIYYSGYGLFLFFAGLLLFFKEKHIAWKVYAAFGGILGFMGVFLGGTRGTFIGLVAGLGVMLLSYSILLKGHKQAKKVLTSIIVIGLVLVTTLFMFRSSTFVRGIPALGRLMNTNIVTTGTGQTRLMAWSIAVDAWQERPVFGWGPNNYYYAFNKYYNPEFLEHGWGETWFDNAHSAPMNTLAVQGIIGFILYMGLFFVPVFILWRGYKQDFFDAHIVSISSGFLAGHFVHNAFVFENPTSYLYFFFFLAFIQSQYIHQKYLVETKQHGTISFGVVAVVLSIVFLFLYATNVNPARANMATLNAIRKVNSGVDPLLTYAETANVPSPHIDDIRNDYIRMIAPLIPKYHEQASTKQVQDIFHLINGELEKNKILHPMDIRIHLTQSQFNSQHAIFMQDAAFLVDSEMILEEALSYSPKRQQIQYMLAAVKLQLNKPQEAVALLQDSIDNNPKIGEGWWRLAGVYEQVEDINTIKNIYSTAIEKGVTFNKQQRSFFEQFIDSTEVTDIVQ
jgi:O-antigen ligase